MPTSRPYNRSRTYQLYLGQQHMTIQFPATHISLFSTNPYIMAANWTNHILTPINCAHTAYTYGTIHLILALQSLLSINVNPTLTIATPSGSWHQDCLSHTGANIHRIMHMRTHRYDKPHPWNPSEVVMVQATDQGGS